VKDGAELFRSEDFQHNRKFRQQRENAVAIAEAVLAALEDAPEEPVKDAPASAALERADSAEAA